MFASFYYTLRDAGIPVRPTAYLTLHRALRMGLSRADVTAFYRLARTVLVKSEKYFDLYDQVFMHCFAGVEMTEGLGDELLTALDQYLAEWLDDPLIRALLTDEEREQLDTEALLKLLEERLAEQSERHDGGGKWIGTGGTSPFGHSGRAKRGVRIGGGSQLRSAIKVAGQRRWRDYSTAEVIREQQIGEAVGRLRRIAAEGPKDELDVDLSIAETCRLGGEIELVFARRQSNRVRLIVMLDNGGWSMDPWIELVSQLFVHIRDRIKRLETYFFHNCIYETVWSDPQRRRGVPIERVLARRPDHRLIIVGDASMAPEELEARGGAIYRWGGDAPPGIHWLGQLRERFERAVWLNPIPASYWRRTYGAYTIGRIGEVFPMFDLSLGGIEAAVESLNEPTL